jgi:EAL domain-containing protein (putative c-di-GMP-specific phosphodiesterase class I)
MGYEALSRGPQGTVLENPVDLFAVAVDENMFTELDALALSLAVQRAGFLSHNHILFLNVNPAFIDADYFKYLDFLKDSKIIPSSICIEITERTCIKNFTKLSSMLEYFQRLGMKIAIDDVGEGYSSLKAIAELKPDFIKAGMSLIRNIDSDTTKNSLVQLIAELAIKMKSHVIAEGIETEEEYKTLLKLGVEYGQGFLFAKPSEYK